MVFMSGIEINLVLASGSNLTCFLCAGQNRPRFCARAENDLVLVWGSIDLVFVRVVEVGLFLYAGRKSLGFWASNLISFLCGWSKLTWFHCGGFNLTLFQYRNRNRLDFGVGVENDLSLVFGSKSTRFYYGYQNWVVFCAGIGVDLVFVRGRKWLGFSV